MFRASIPQVAEPHCSFERSVAKWPPQILWCAWLLWYYGKVIFFKASSSRYCIENFSLFFKDLNTQTKSTKIHILFSHVQAICLKNEPALGVYSEQAGKSIHAKFSESARHRLPKDSNHRSFKSKLLDVMVSHNAERI